jgi:hypothetical protein
VRRGGAIVVALAVAAQACTVTRYAKVRVVSDPDLAYVEVAETGNYVESTPGNGIVRTNFWLWQPRRATYHFTFRKRGMCDDTVRVKMVGIWRRTRGEADGSVEPIVIHGLLGAQPCSKAPQRR